MITAVSNMLTMLEEVLLWHKGDNPQHLLTEHCSRVYSTSNSTEFYLLIFFFFYNVKLLFKENTVISKRHNSEVLIPVLLLVCSDQEDNGTLWCCHWQLDVFFKRNLNIYHPLYNYKETSNSVLPHLLCNL